MKRKKMLGNTQKIKIVLIQPWLSSPDIIPAITPPVGLMYLASMARQRLGSNCVIEIIDARLKKLDCMAVAEKVSRIRPDIVGISVISFYVNEMHKIAALIKKSCPETLIIVGGPHISAEKKLTDENIDIAVIGEGEVVFDAILGQYIGAKDFSGIPGIIYRKENKVYSNAMNLSFIEDLDAIPFPAYDLIDIKQYADLCNSFKGIFTFREQRMGVFTSRGCPNGCIYCHNIFGRKFRARSPENVFKEILLLHEKYSVKEFSIYDDVFNCDRNRAEKIADLIIESKMDIVLIFICGFRIDSVDEALLRKLKACGTKFISYGIESGSQRIQALIGKNIDLNKASAVIEMTNKLEIFTGGHFVIGFPGETLEEINATIKYAAESKIMFPGIQMVMPYEGTALRKLGEKIPGYDLSYDVERFGYAEAKMHRVGNKSYSLSILRRQGQMKCYFNLARMCMLWRVLSWKVCLRMAIQLIIFNSRFIRCIERRCRGKHV
ncbi:MAG: radical SAM protein [Candidatus Omnitrophota bacterium]